MLKIATRVNTNNEGSSLGIKKRQCVVINEIMYVDNMLLRARNRTELQDRLTTWAEVLKEFLKINVTKTKILFIT